MYLSITSFSCIGCRSEINSINTYIFFCRYRKLYCWHNLQVALLRLFVELCKTSLHCLPLPIKIYSEEKKLYKWQCYVDEKLDKRF